MCHLLSWEKQTLLVFFHVYGTFYRIDLLFLPGLLSPEAQTVLACQPSATVSPSGFHSSLSPQVPPLPMEPWAVGQVAQGMSR